MATLAEQLAALPLAHSLQSSGMPASFTKLPWAVLNEGTWLETGWSPASYILAEEPSSRSGAYLNSTLYKGNIAVGVTREGGGSLANGDRRLGLWLHSAVGAKPSGYQLQWVTISKENTVKLVLSRWIEGERKVLAEVAEVSMALGDSFYLALLNGKLLIWRQAGVAQPELLTEASDSTFTEGRIGIDGNGSNPAMTNLVAGEVTEPPAAGAPSPPTVVRAEPESGRLAFYLRRPDGTEKRLAGDEPEAEDVGQGFTLGTSIPGGYTTANLGLTRDPRIDYGDFDIFDEFVARGPGGEHAYEGYDIEIPASGDEQVRLVATGWQGLLKDNPTLQEVYVDRDLARWGAASAARKITLLSSSFAPNDPSTLIDPTTGLPAIELGFEGSWVSPWKPRAEAWYDAGPSARVARVIFSWQLISPAGGSAPWNLYIVSQPTDNSGSEELSSDLRDTVGDAGSAVFTPNAKNRYARFRFEYETSPAGADGISYKCHVRGVVVVGNHNVPLVAGNCVLASDVVADIVSRAAPLLNYTTGSEGSIQPSSYSIPHLTFPEPVTGEEGILQASKYDVPDWGVYNDREFFWRPPSSGTLWIARQGDPGTSLDDAGKQAEDIYTGVLVQFTDPSGKSFTVGPPGTPGCDYTDASLQDYSETNPLNERGRVRLGKLVVSAITTLAGAIQLGSRWLTEEMAVADRGTAVLTGFVQDSSRTYEPVWKVRAGDRVRFDDADGRERRIIETSYDHEARTVTLTLDSTPHRLEALMEKMQVELVAVGAGS